MTGYIKLETIGKMGDMISQLQYKLDIAVNALEDIRTAYQFSGACGDGYEMDAIAKQALEEIGLIGASAKEEV